LPAPTNTDFSLAIPFSRRLKPAIVKFRPDIIHVHSPFLLGRLGAKCARNIGIPLVFTFHTLYDLYVHYIPFGQEIARQITRRYYRDFCNGCDLVITPTEIIADHLRKNGIISNIKPIPTGIDIEKFRNQDNKWVHRHYGLSHNTRVLLCVGRLGKEKNLGFIIEMYSRIAEKYPDTVMVMVGGGPEELNLKNRAKELGLKEKVIFAGMVDSQEIFKYYCSAYLFVFASVTETQGLVLGEAKAAGVPSVAVSAYGVREMVSHGEDGYLTPLNMDDFTEKIDLLLQDEELRNKMGDAAIQNSVKMSSRNCAEMLIKVYEDLICNSLMQKRENLQ